MTITVISDLKLKQVIVVFTHFLQRKLIITAAIARKLFQETDLMLALLEMEMKYVS